MKQQINELGWNDTTVKVDVKLDDKKVMESMRGWERTDIMLKIKADLVVKVEE